MAYKQQATYRAVAERALGKPLPEGAEVHHVNMNPRDNRPQNLVICQDKAYHHLLHARMRERGITKDPEISNSYILRGIDPEQWHKFRTKALAEKVSLKDLIIRLLTQWLEA